MWGKMGNTCAFFCAKGVRKYVVSVCVCRFGPYSRKNDELWISKCHVFCINTFFLAFLSFILVKITRSQSRRLLRCVSSKLSCVYMINRCLVFISCTKPLQKEKMSFTYSELLWTHFVRIRRKNENINFVERKSELTSVYQIR